MKNFSLLREGLTKVLLLTAAGLLTAFLLFWIVFTMPWAKTAAQTNQPPPNGTPVPGVAVEQPSPEDIKRREAWRESMTQIAVPKKGCFKTDFPKTQWQEVQCVTPPLIPMQPKQGVFPLVVGNGVDVSAQSPAGFITSATGSFDSVTGVTSESGPIGNSGPPVANAYTLQINTDFFNSATACAGSPNPGCRGWEQFVFFNNGTSGMIFIQYWLIQYNAACPAGVGWNQFSFTSSPDIYCFKNSPTATAVPNQPITNLSNLVMTGTATAAGDQNTLSTGSTMFAVTGDNAVNAASGWQIAEFNVFGPGGNSSGASGASFNAGSTVVPRTRITYGGTAPPICTAAGFTGETNNLSFGPTAPAPSAPGPAILFTESSGGGALSNCAAATAVGDTHLKTFGGLFYDFQASGDFVLAQTDPDFVVQTRQVSGAPNWPNASVNSAVATQMGKDKVALCLEPGGLNINGNATELGDGQSLSLPDQAGVVRRGNVYFIRDQGGNYVRAQLNPTWIDVSVGLGRWPAEVSGLLANVNGNINQVAARDGRVLTNPFPFEELYHHFADSWRVPEKDSLLSVCRGKVERSSPTKPFYANDLEPEVRNRARQVCTAAGVKDETLLDACTLDVAVIGNETAAKVFGELLPPVAVAKPAAVAAVSEWPWFLKWLLLGLLLLILLAILWWFLKKKP